MRLPVSALAFVLIVGTSSQAVAQTVYRLKGSARSGETPVPASVVAEAIAGFRGEQFTGQGGFTVQGNDKGEWNLLGLTSGVWLITASAPDALPGAIVLPIKFSQRQMQSAQGGQLNWAWPFQLAAASAHPLLQKAAPLVAEGRTVEAVQFVATALLPEATVADKCVAGQMALAIKQTSLAQQLFLAGQQAEPKNGCGPVGLASVALMARDWDTASKMLWAARDLVPRDQRPALAAAINELQQVARVQ
jgi:hypothetical protein